MDMSSAVYDYKQFLICKPKAMMCIYHHVAAHCNGDFENVMVFLQDKVHPQTIAVLQSRADGLGLTVEVGDETKFNVDKDVSGVLVQYPATDGTVHDYKVCPETLHYTSAGCVPFTAMLFWQHSTCEHLSTALPCTKARVVSKGHWRVA